MVLAASSSSPFPDITFKAFSKFILSNFNKEITLASVLLLLSTMLENPDFLNLHFRRSRSIIRQEKASTKWMELLAKIFHSRLEDCEIHAELLGDNTVPQLAGKLNDFALLLKLDPYNSSGSLVSKRKSVDYSITEALHIIAPISFECETMTCEARSLYNYMKYDDIAQVTLLKDSKVYRYAYVIGAKCGKCNVAYLADHEHIPAPHTGERCLLNDAAYVKIGQNLWADHVMDSSLEQTNP
jgi:hypothetical protein